MRVVVNSVPSVVGAAGDEGLNEINPEKAQQINEGGDEREKRGELGESENVEGGGVVDLLTPAVEKEVGSGEEESEENGVCEEERKRKSVGGFGRRELFIWRGGRLKRSPANVHFSLIKYQIPAEESKIRP